MAEVFPGRPEPCRLFCTGRAGRRPLLEGEQPAAAGTTAKAHIRARPASAAIQPPLSVARMQHHLYVARDRDFTPVAALGPDTSWPRASRTIAVTR